LRDQVARCGDGWLLPVPAFTPEQGRALAKSGNPVFAEMAGIELQHLPTGHWPMFSRPAELAGLLATLAGPDHAQ
jgi:hypothetical protein